MPDELIKNQGNSVKKTSLWNILGGPVKVGLLFAVIAIIMALVGIF